MNVVKMMSTIGHNAMKNEQNEHLFEKFLKSFVPKISSKSKQLYQALWILETTGSSDAADLKAELDTELRLAFNDSQTYEKLLKWDTDISLKDPLLKRQLNVLIRTFKQNMIPQKLLEEISKKEAALLLSYANFRPVLEGKTLSENDIRDILKKEHDPSKRKMTWEASKFIGNELATQILDLVAIRNEGARSVGYKNYFQMQLDLQEVDGPWLFTVLEDLAKQSEAPYLKVMKTIEQQLARKFQVRIEDLGPWAWSEPFGQEDPIDSCELDTLINDVNISDVSIKFFQKMAIDILPILQQSDMYERPGKNQHAFCINIDRASDVRTLNNVKQTIKWLETVLHEFGHAIYELGFDSKLPWLLREPPHMITTEAMALLVGRQAYLPEVLCRLIGHSENHSFVKMGAESLKRRQLIFSRWVQVMTYFEKELYSNPEQDLNKLWWHLVNKYQKIPIPQGREGKNDWAAKYHIGLAPVYYFSYLLGEMFASAIEEALMKTTGSKELATKKAGDFLQQKLFFPGNRMNWSDLIFHVIGKPLSSDAWIRQFC